MRARLKRLHSPDVADLETWSPASDRFGFLLEAMIGPSDGPGEEAFTMTVCTPAWFAAERMTEAIVRSGRHTLFVASYDYRALHGFIERAAHSVDGPDWGSLAVRLSWLGQWEFAK